MGASDERLLGRLEEAVRACTEQLKGLNERLDEKEHKPPCVPLVRLTTRINTAWIAILLLSAAVGYGLNIVICLSGQ